jgi:tRNA U55 pseudouridine synthase TruB
VRVLAEDIAAKLANVAHLTELSRTRLGQSELDLAFDSQMAESIPETIKKTPQDLLTHFSRIELDELQFKALIQGKRPLYQPGQVPSEALYRAFYQDLFLGLVRVQNDQILAERFMNTTTWQNY